jgi:hypothetical protein
VRYREGVAYYVQAACCDAGMHAVTPGTADVQ